MLYELDPLEFHRVKPLFRFLDYNLAPGSILAGKTPARIWVDNPERPASAFTAFKHRWFLAGSPANRAFNQALSRLFIETIFPQMLAAGLDSFVLHFDSEAWETSLDLILPGRYPLKGQRMYFECTGLRLDWRELLPPEFALRPVDAGLVSQPQIENLDELRAELCSERSTVEDFLEKSFGFCVLHGDELASWCLSEYNHEDRCEVGVATREMYQRRSLGTLTTLALVEHALLHGYRRIGWHCWARNTASIALALRAGFKKVRDYPVYLCLLDLPVQLALHGNELRLTGAYSQAFTWYEKACALDGAPDWAFYNAARCLARMDQGAAALSYLRRAIQHGFDDLDHLRTDPDLESLHQDAAWRVLLKLRS